MRRRHWVLVPAGAAAIATATGGAAVMSGAPQATAASTPVPVNTAQVERRALSAVVSVAGTLTYRARPDGSPYLVIDQAAGTYTKLPEAGQVISQGGVLYRVNDRPVVLLYGATPAYRTLTAGIRGPDVKQLNADLVALGYASRARLSPSSASFDPATSAAVTKLQGALGMNRNGTLTLGQVVFEPTALRVTDVSAELGGRSQPGETLLAATSTARQVQVALAASQQAEVAVGNKVTITLPDNQTTPGVVSSVARVATCPPSAAPGGSSSSAAAAGADSCSSSDPATSTPTITVDVTFSHPAPTGAWDQAPVQVGITTASVRDALTVPVNALLARSGSGYAVELAGPKGANRLVPVSLGLFDDADGTVQVTGSGLTAGERVVVPST